MVLLLIHRLGLDKARTVLAIGDGAHWIWRGVREHLSSLGVTVVEILDYWHGVEHLWKLANALPGQGTKEATTWVKSREGDLLGGRRPDFFKSLEEALEQAKGVSKDLAGLVGKELNDFRNNEGRIDHARYLASWPFSATERSSRMETGTTSGGLRPRGAGPGTRPSRPP